MRSLTLALTLSLVAGPLAAQDAVRPAPNPVAPSAISAEIAARGIAPVLADLRARADTAPEQRFALAGLEFLAALEATYQWRQRHGVGSDWGMIFGSGAELPEAAAPEAFPPEALADQTRDVLAAMARVQKPLAGLAEGPAFSLTLALSDLWFDVDGDGKRADWEGAGNLLDGVAYVREPRQDAEGNAVPPGDFPIVRFDNADAAWLSAYAHLISGGAELLLAFDPTPSLQKVWDARQKIDRHRFADEADLPLGGFDVYLEPLAVALDMLRHQPEAARTRAARDHWLQTIAQNRQFWSLVEAETDNAGEWIPNDRQVSATGLEFPQGTGSAWLGVLADGEALLQGQKSAPFWRASVGLDLGKWLENPTPLPLDGVIQGWAVTDLFTEAPMVTPENLDRFTRMFLGESPFLAMVMIN